ncbi:unnamed protein product [Eruca vesicaria subsp. sativa]|uniref:BRCT domain-containing protein n=1 Tax=Eruca vesicaria subsp. sativa TaxID=29727 RepID=A0ABC8IVJ1_ERUVS|nr:unnamed protein product [Eruca vesicaria subsp. sativa]
MGKLKNNFPANIEDTQPIDSLPSSPSHSGEERDSWIGSFADELMQDTVPFEDDAWISDEYTETQVMDNECGTEEFLLCCETQAVDLGLVEEEQLIQGSDGLDTQVLDRFDDNVVVADSDDDDDVTVFLEDYSEREVSDCGDSRSKGGNLLISEDQNREHANENTKSTVDVDAECGISGKVARYASVRSAAFRASAVAARVAAQKLLNSDCSTLANCHSSDQTATHYSRPEPNIGDVRDQDCPPNMPVEKKNEGNRTARKLFPEDDSPEENCPPPGLSYIDSQEPGEASQANALEFVDKLISESGIKFDVEVGADCGKRTEEKSKSIPSVKGPQELAKKASYKARAVGNSIFDWDDNREDEGGGDICRRRRDEIFGVTSKARRSSSTLLDKRKVHSDSRLLHSSVTRGGKMIQAATKNLGKELDAVSDEHNKKISDMRELVALGYDSQVAAEAIDAVCSGEGKKVDACSTGKKLPPGEERGFSNGGVITRQAKGTKRIQAMGKDELFQRRMKKASPSPAKSCGKSTERSSKRRKVHTASRETKKNLVNELDKVSKDSNTRMFDRGEEVEAGPDTQMAAEAINDLHSGDAREINHESNCLIGKKSSREGAVTRKSKRLKGIQALDNDVESLKPKFKKAKSIHAKACEENLDSYSENEKHDMPDEVVVSITEKKREELSNKHCKSKLLKQSSGGEAEVLSNPMWRRSARISQDQENEAGRSSDPAFDTPVKSKAPSKTVSPSNAPSKNVSPICMGDEYHRLTCKVSRTSNTTNELRNLTLPFVQPIPEAKSTRKRRDLASIRVLFSQHLDEDVTKHQKKILAKFDISEASSMMEATHFIADNFMRTRNMLEAIASGKPVVTTQWLESIDQVNIYVDEELYILRDSKKEKEFGFNMGVSLTRARQNPLLKGRRVFITPNTKPGLNTITTLVKAVHGQPIERLGRTVLSEDKVPENLLILSCEEDRDISIPFLERGSEVYSSELLLNGIVTQKLEYERYRLFTDHVRRTRSTIWVRDGKGKFQRRRG